jgi:cellulose 1,4-beta-cellobiosidase
MRSSFIVAVIASATRAQQVGTYTSEYHAPFALGVCSIGSGCQTQMKSVVMDANWRWTHKLNDYSNCYQGTSWDLNSCPDGLSCARNCALDGIDYNALKSTYGIETTTNHLKMGFVT